MEPRRVWGMGSEWYTSSATPVLVREVAKKVICFSGPATRRGKGGDSKKK